MPNQEKRIFYVYAHRRLDNEAVFYIGKGCGNRAYTPHGRSNLWGRIAAKYGFSVEIIKECLTEQEAFREEILAIASSDGLCNFTAGGEGVSGYTHTKETRDRLSAVHSGRKQRPEVIAQRADKIRGQKRTPEFGDAVRQRNLGRKATDETKAKMRAIRIGKKLPRDQVEKTARAHRGMTRSDEARQRMRDAQPKKAVLCVETGRVFESITLAAAWAKIMGNEKAAAAAIHRRINSSTPGKTYGYAWVYHNV